MLDRGQKPSKLREIESQGQQKREVAPPQKKGKSSTAAVYEKYEAQGD